MKISKTDRTMIAIAMGMFMLLGTLTILDKVNANLHLEKEPDFERPLGSMYEDQVIICVPNLDTDTHLDHICHLYNADDLDWYQDSKDGTFFSNEDSFDMRVVE